jgi:hypothetical protein
MPLPAKMDNREDVKITIQSTYFDAGTNYEPLHVCKTFTEIAKESEYQRTPTSPNLKPQFKSWPTRDGAADVTGRLKPPHKLDT